MSEEAVVGLSIVGMFFLAVCFIFYTATSADIKTAEIKKQLIKEVTKQVIELEKAKESTND